VNADHEPFRLGCGQSQVPAASASARGQI
jgi:hypothetical protein